MKKILSLIIVMSILTACSTTVAVKGSPAKPLPPGQAKKVVGTQSAKPFTPGQQKKKN